MPAHRSPVAVTAAMNRDIIDRFRLATAVGLGVALAVWLLTGYLRFDGADSLGTAAAGGLAFGLVTAAVLMAPYLRPRELRVLDAIFAIARRSARARVEAYGDGSVPETPRLASAWLARHPDDTPQTRGARVWAQLVLGDLEAASSLAASMPDASPIDRFHRGSALAMVRVVEGGDPRLDDLRQLAAELDAAGRDQAEIDIALLDALVRAADGADWRAAILGVRHRLEPALGMVVVRWFLPLAGYVAAGALAISLVAYGFSLIAG